MSPEPEALISAKEDKKLQCKSVQAILSTSPSIFWLGRTLWISPWLSLVSLGSIKTCCDMLGPASQQLFIS